MRKVPKQFSWLNQRLVRDRHSDRLSLPAAAFYLFLVTVCDAKGLSYWSDAAVMQLLNIDQQTLADARKNLLAARLIVWKSLCIRCCLLIRINPIHAAQWANS